jgi:two-component system cell cycle sensor histidine kinase/response regulator CckA
MPRGGGQRRGGQKDMTFAGDQAESGPMSVGADDGGSLEARVAADAPRLGEAHYRVLVETMAEAFAYCRLILDDRGAPLDWLFEEANDAFCKLLGATDIVGKTVRQLSPGINEAGSRALELFGRALATGKPATEELYSPALDRWLAVKVAASPTPDHFLVVLEDITERRQTMDALQRVTYSLDHIDDYPLWVDSGGWIVNVSESTCRHLEYSRDELLSMTVWDIDPDMTPERWSARWAHPEQAERLLEVRQRKKGGEVFPVEIVSSRLPLAGQVYDCGFCRDISDRKRLEETLLVTRLVVDQAPEMIDWSDSDGRLVYANRAACDLTGYSLEELLSLHVWDLDPQTTEEIWRDTWKNIKKRGAVRFETNLKDRDSCLHPVEVSASYVELEGKEYGVAFLRDISERTAALKTIRERDEQLRQSQKMEANGRLAGGIAHDFNNVLTTIIGYSDLILSTPESPTETLLEDVGEIRAAAERASGLTKQILAFSRRQALRPELLSLNRVISDTERMLARVLGADVQLKTALGDDVGQVEVDEHQFIQILLNLAVNARDAMPRGGTLTVETADIDLDEEFCQTHPDAKPGSYVLVAITDTGTGMDADTLAHAFEPFFTTKPKGEGTGLGLPTVYGVVAQSGGCVYVYSEPGRGTTFDIYLPRVDGVAPLEEAGAAAGPTARKTILVLDSDDVFRNFITKILNSRGYRTIPAGDSDQAIAILANPDIPIDLLLAELVMTGSPQGVNVGEKAPTLRPGLPVLFMSAFTRDTMEKSARIGEEPDYLEKPFTADALTSRVRESLDSGQAGTAPTP